MSIQNFINFDEDITTIKTLTNEDIVKKVKGSEEVNESGDEDDDLPNEDILLPQIKPWKAPPC